jgi:predicted transcriptional regulator
MKVLLSIKPEFAEKIFDGSKRFEFRRNVFKNRDVRTVVVYASSPISKVVGEFDIEMVIRKELEELYPDYTDKQITKLLNKEF